MTCIFLKERLDTSVSLLGKDVMSSQQLYELMREIGKEVNTGFKMVNGEYGRLRLMESKLIISI